MLKVKFKIYSHNKYAFPIILFLITFITYGLLSPWMKFFHDEYSILLFHQRFKDVTLFFEGNRPFLGYVYKPLLVAFGSNYYCWLIFGITMRWLQAYCFYLLIKEIWGDKQYFAVTASLFCLIFPPFQAQFAFIMFGILFLLFTFFLLSLKFSLMALKRINLQKSFLIILALVFSLFNLITSEYFFTLEILRYLIFGFYLFSVNEHNWFKKLIRESAPYLMLFISMSIWRFFTQSAETAYSFNNNLAVSSFSFQMILNFVKKMMIDIWKVSIGAWINSFFPSHLLENLSTNVMIIFLFITTAVGLICYIYLYHLEDNKPFTKIQKFSIISFSIIAIFSAGIPFWIAKLPIGEFYMFSRWTTPFMLGVSILFAFIFQLSNHKKLISLVCAILIAVGTGNQLLVANSFRHDWNKQLAYLWQFKWRIPSLRENTTIFSNMLDFNYENSDEISGALNFFYPTPQDHRIPLFQFYLPERVGTALLPEIKSGIPLLGRHYYDSFKGISSQVIIVDFQYPACFKVLDPEIDVFNPSIDTLSKEALFLSDTGLILDIQTELDEDSIRHIFGKQPDPNWCFYFEKADLARQVEDWDLIHAINEKVNELGLFPRDQREWFPFIEGFGQNNDWAQAVVLSKTVYNKSPQYAQMLQALWDRINTQTDDSPEKSNAINSIGLLLNES